MPRRDIRAMVPIIHALIAVAVLFVLLSSWWMMALPLPSKVFTYRAFPFQLHKNVGITVVFLVAILLYSHLKYVAAARKSGRARARMSGAARLQSVLLYGLVLACCLSGYLSSSYSGWGTRLWWLVNLPNWGYDNDELNILYSAIHIWTCYGLLVIIAVHVGDAMYRAFRDDGTTRRMIRL
jgi:cytochrome b561